MAKIIEFPGKWLPAEPPSTIVQLSGDDFPPEEYSRWWRLARDILRCCGASGLRLNQRGDIPDELARQLHQAHIRPELEQTSPGIGSEADSPDIRFVHQILVTLDFVRIKKGYLTRTRAGTEMAEDPIQLYPHIFDQALFETSWVGQDSDNAKSREYLQKLAAQSLVLLGETCTAWTNAGLVMDAAASHLVLPDQEDAAEVWYQVSLQEYFLPLGLVKIRCFRQDLRRWTARDEELCISPLFQHFLGTI